MTDAPSSTVMTVLAHGVGGRTDLPLTAWQAGWSAGVALAFSFVALGLLWRQPQLRSLAAGRPLGATTAGVQWRVVPALRWITMALFVVVITAGLVGQDDTGANAVPVVVYVAFWVGIPLLAVLIGPFWSSLSPWETLAGLSDREDPECRPVPPSFFANGWATLVPVSAFLWLELVYHDGAQPRVLGWAALGYTLTVIGISYRWGRDVARSAEGFGTLFSLIARLSPIGRGPSGRLVVRPPLVGAVVDDLRPSELALVLVVLGGTAFDGMSRTRFWSEVSAGRSGWESTAVGTIGLLWMVILVGVLFHLASRFGDRLTGRTGFSDQFGHSLLPILLGYHVAHYFSMLVLEGQMIRVLASDPYGRGWDLFGTASDAVNWTLVSPTTVGWVQLGAIISGHLAGVLVAHDRSVELWQPATALRSQYPMFAVMVLYTVFGLVLMTG